MMNLKITDSGSYHVLQSGDFDYSFRDIEADEYMVLRKVTLSLFTSCRGPMLKISGIPVIGKFMWTRSGGSFVFNTMKEAEEFLAENKLELDNGRKIAIKRIWFRDKCTLPTGWYRVVRDLPMIYLIPLEKIIFKSDNEKDLLEYENLLTGRN